MLNRRVESDVKDAVLLADLLLLGSLPEAWVARPGCGSCGSCDATG